MIQIGYGLVAFMLKEGRVFFFFFWGGGGGGGGFFVLLLTVSDAVDGIKTSLKVAVHRGLPNFTAMH
jgi:hypothetical protein